MPSHLPPTIGPPLLDAEAAPNGATPRASFLRRAADGMNAIAVYSKKVILLRCQRMTSVETTARVFWPVYFRTGENTTGLRVRLGLLDTNSGTATDPNVTCTVYDATTGASVVAKTFYYNGRTAPTPGDAYAVLNRTNLVAMELTGLSANTEYVFTTTTADGARVVYDVVHEIGDKHADDAVTGVVDPTKFIVDGPIYDEHVQDLLDAGDKHWRHSASHYLNWHPTGSGITANSVAATTYTNVLDGTTAYAASSLGYVIAAQYHGHALTPSTGHGVKIAVKAIRTAGAGSLSVRLFDGTNSIELTGTTTGGMLDWYTGTAVIPQTTTKWDVQAKVSVGGTTFDLYAVCVFAWES